MSGSVWGSDSIVREKGIYDAKLYYRSVTGNGSSLYRRIWRSDAGQEW